MSNSILKGIIKEQLVTPIFGPHLKIETLKEISGTGTGFSNSQKALECNSGSSTVLDIQFEWNMHAICTHLEKQHLIT